LRTAELLLVVLLVSGTPLSSQQPTVSPALEPLLTRDTVIAVWFFGDERRTLDDLAALVIELGGTVRRRSRWLHAVSANIRAPALEIARTRPELRRLQLVARFVGRLPLPSAPAVAPPPGVAGATMDTTFGPAAMPLRQLNLFPLVRRGLSGNGVTIAILDSGFETEEPAFTSAIVAGQFDFVFNDSVVRNEPQDDPTASRHGTQVWSLLAANLPNQIVGLAPEARYLLAKTEDVRSETRVEEDNYVAALEWADSLDAAVVTSSLAYLSFDDGFSYEPDDLNGDIAVTTVAADAAAARGISVVTAAGNRGVAGFRSLVTPADGDSVVAAGAEDSLGVLQTFSSRGPTADGRLKPDLTAPGRDVFVLDPFVNSGFSRVSGTSFSAPLLAGTIALLREAHPLFSPIEAHDALRRTGTNRVAPDSSSGWGRPDGAAAVTFPRGIIVLAPADSVLTSATPLFEWSTPAVPIDAMPVSYRLEVARDTLFSAPVLDTVLSETMVTLLEPQRPGDQLAFRITATSVDTVSLVAQTRRHVMPVWTELTTLNDPAGNTIRDPRPLFEWTSVAVATPPGPFTYDVQILRTDQGTVEVAVDGLTTTQFRPNEDLERNTPYQWRVVTRLADDSVVTESEGTLLIIDDSVPTTTLLFQNFPNPFPQPATPGSTTCFWFDLAVRGTVRLDILDMRGHVVRRVFPSSGMSAELPPGRYGRPAVEQPGQCDPQFEWDGTATDGTFLPRGIYLVKLTSPAGVFFKRIVYMGRDL
jgi:hypothetical protein